VGYSIGFLYAYLGLTIPHSVAVNLAFPSEIPVNGELLPQSPVLTQVLTRSRLVGH
jgi:hypothetical protein